MGIAEDLRAAPLDVDLTHVPPCARSYARLDWRVCPSWTEGSPQGTEVAAWEATSDSRKLRALWGQRPARGVLGVAGETFDVLEAPALTYSLPRLLTECAEHGMFLPITVRQTEGRDVLGLIVRSTAGPPPFADVLPTGVRHIDRGVVPLPSGRVGTVTWAAPPHPRQQLPHPLDALRALAASGGRQPAR